MTSANVGRLLPLIAIVLSTQCVSLRAAQNIEATPDPYFKPMAKKPDFQRSLRASVVLPGIDRRETSAQIGGQYVSAVESPAIHRSRSQRQNCRFARQNSTGDCH